MKSPFCYERTGRFAETDAAGVVYFANVLNLCHEAYEASLEAAGIDLQAFFTHAPIAVPIVHATVDFFRPLYCGDRLQIELYPQKTAPESFEVIYALKAFTTEQASRPDAALRKAAMPNAAPARVMSQAKTRHLCIDRHNRHRALLPNELCLWLDQFEPV